MAGIEAILEDLTAEYDRIDAMLAPLDAQTWVKPSVAVGWSVADIVAHLALSEEVVVRSVADADADAHGVADASGPASEDVDVAMAAEVTVAGLDGPAAFARWRAARRASVEALAGADPDRPLRWAAAPLKPRTLATTRLAEHWAHGLDLAETLGVDFPDTARLRQIAWLGHATLPYAFRLAGLDPVAVRAELTGPAGDLWSFGPPEAPTRILGPAGDFCRLGARRVRPDATDLTATGPNGADVLRLLRNWA